MPSLADILHLRDRVLYLGPVYLVHTLFYKRQAAVSDAALGRRAVQYLNARKGKVTAQSLVDESGLPDNASRIGSSDIATRRHAHAACEAYIMIVGRLIAHRTSSHIDGSESKCSW
jgi:hypothetical protein